jgi:hypothetical protein
MFGWRVDSGTVNTVTQQGIEHGTFNTAFISGLKSDEESFWASGVAVFDGQVFVSPTAGGFLPERAGGPLSSLAAGRSDSTLARLAHTS